MVCYHLPIMKKFFSILLITFSYTFEVANAVGKYGAGSIYNKIAENILKLGGQINYNQTVKGLDTKENKINYKSDNILKEQFKRIKLVAKFQIE